MTLYELTSEYLELLEMADDPEVDPQTVADTMEGLGGEIVDKLDAYVVILKKLEAENAMDDAEVKRLQARARTRTRNIEMLKAAMVSGMRALDVKRLPTEHFRLAIVKNGGKQPIEYTGEVPIEFCRVELQRDAEKVRAALESGEALDFARLGDRGEHLTIK